MITIRNNTFETNSSSTHSICIPKNCEYNNLSHVSFNLGEFGWTTAHVDACNYLYTAIVELEKYYNYRGLDKLKEILDKNNVTYDFEEVDDKKYFYIDHVEDLVEFVDKCLSDEEYLLRFLSYGEVYTGNDNDFTEYEDDEIPERLLAYYKPEEELYDYYYKSN